MQLLQRILDRVEKIITIFTGFLLVVLALLICVQVFARYVLAAGLFWAYEISLRLMMWIGLLGAAGCVWTELHMRLSLVLERIPLAVRRWLHVGIDLLLGVFAFILFTQGIDRVRNTLDTAIPTVPLAEGYANLVVPVSGLLMMVFLAMHIVRRVWEIFSKKQEAP